MGGAHAPLTAYQALDCRIVAEIQRNVVRLGKRNAICRFVRAKSDKRRIAAWRLDLNGILQVFQVRSGVASKWITLTSCFQIELAMHTHPAVSDAPHDVSNTTTITSEIHRNALKNPEDVDDINQAASVFRTMTVTE
jgi:hypothetical protein